MDTFEMATLYSMSSMTLIFSSLAAAIVAAIFATSIYNLFFHPLAKFPGPWFGAISEWFVVVYICAVPTYGLHLHRKYGPVVRLAPNLLSFSDATLLPRVYHHSADKPAFYGSWMFGNTASMFQSLRHQDHYAKKRLVAPCCSMSAMKKHHEAKISERIEELCTKLLERSSVPGKPIDFSEYLRYFLNDVWNHLAYGEPKGHVTEGRDVDGELDAIQGVYSMSAYAAVMPWLMPLLRHPLLRKYLWVWTKTFCNMKKIYATFDSMRDRRNNDEKLKSQVLFFDGLEPEKNPTEFQYSREDLKAEFITFTAATLDGVAAFISPFIDNLITHPEAHQRILAEIQVADRNGELSRPVVTYTETTQLPFFMACIKETLRRDAPAQTILPRVVSEPGYDLFGGRVHVPAGTQMGASPYILHRDEAVFGPEPEKWKPERWIQAESGMSPTDHTEYVRRMEKYGMWWGYGDRECAGKYYAYVEMQKLCVELIRRFDIQSATKERFHHERWAVGMFWNQQLIFKARTTS